MAEQFEKAALRHLGTAEELERSGHEDDACYHYGLVGETSIKASLVKVLGSVPKELFRHINDDRGALQNLITTHAAIQAALMSGRLGGGVAAALHSKISATMFAGWSIKIRYADTDHPVDSTKMASWKADAIALVNGGVF